MKKKAFTLIELLVVVAIIGLLAAMAVIALNSARARARDARRVADVKQMQTALEMYYLDQNSYPDTPAATWTAPAGYCLATSSKWTTTCVGATTYMTVGPTAPSPYDSSACADDNAYSYAGTETTYSLKYCLGSAVAGIAAGVHTASASGL